MRTVCVCVVLLRVFTKLESHPRTTGRFLPRGDPVLDRIVNGSKQSGGVECRPCLAGHDDRPFAFLSNLSADEKRFGVRADETADGHDRKRDTLQN